MGHKESEGPSSADLKSRLTSGLADDLFIFGILALGCLLFLAASIALHFGVASTATEAEADLTELPYAVGQPAGARAVLTGTIADDTEPLFKNFVAYVEETYRGRGKYQVGDDWEITGGRQRVFQVNTPSGAMDLADPNYTLSPRVNETNKALLPDWDHADARIKEPPGTFEGAKRYRGLVVGGPVTAVGTVTADGTFDADYVIGTGLEDAQQRLKPVASGESSSFAYWLTLIGAAGLALTVLMFVRARLKKAFDHTGDQAT